MTAEEAIADLAIRKTLARLSDSIFRRDPVAHGACYARQGEWHAFGAITRGRDAVVQHWLAVIEDFPFAWQTIGSLIIEVTGDTAAARGSLDEIVRMRDGTVMRVMGMQHLVLVLEDDDWRIQVNRYDQIFFGTPALHGQFFPILDYGPPPHDPDPDRMTRPIDIGAGPTAGISPGA